MATTWYTSLAVCARLQQLVAPLSPRRRIKTGVRDHNLMWNEIADCEVWEATEAMFNGNNAAAVEELYDVIAVLLRTIDVLEGRQALGKPKEGGAE